jgi:hypothetical protein
MLAGSKIILAQATGRLGSRDDRPGLVDNLTKILKKQLSCEEGQNMQLAAPSGNIFEYESTLGSNLLTTRIEN